MNYTTGDITKIVLGQGTGSGMRVVSRVCIDSRSIDNAESCLFVALRGNIVDGHDYVKQAYNKGVRSFLLSRKADLSSDVDCIIVKDTLRALQIWAAYHRGRYNISLVAITGSNGKTIIKEWLSQLLSRYRKVVKSPKSYNSQVGVPLSVLQLESYHEVAVFEAGISTSGEMSHLQKILQPSIGIFSNLGDAHDGGFKDRDEKFEEKSALFDQCNCLIYHRGDDNLHTRLSSRFESEILHGYEYQLDHNGEVDFLFYGKSRKLTIPFKDHASIQNVLAAVATMCMLGIDIRHIQQDINQLHRVDQRMVTLTGKWNSLIINDTYSADLESLDNAVTTLRNSDVRSPLIVLSDLMDNMPHETLYLKVADILDKLPDLRLITVGNDSIVLKGHLSHDHIAHYQNVDAIHLDKALVQDTTVLIKGARAYRMERLVDRLSAQSHTATLEIDMMAMEHNLSVYAGLVPPSCKLMTVIKASAYGSGALQLARNLQHRQVGYMAVANVDEGIQLREGNIKTPIIILNPDFHQIEAILQYNLEPEVYSLEQLRWISQSISHPIRIHLKIETGMYRLGLMPEDIDPLLDLLRSNDMIQVASIFSHLAASDTDLAYTHQQIRRYEESYERITAHMSKKPIRHLANTAAITRYPEAHYDMVRLGIGLYGIDSLLPNTQPLEKVHGLYASVLQIKKILKDETVGYNRAYRLDRDSNIAIVNIGYADGLMRGSGNGKHRVWINGHYAPIIGNICMDLIMVDVTGIEVDVGDRVEIFGKNVSIEDLANVNDTIPYEVLARISSRVNKKYLN